MKSALKTLWHLVCYLVLGLMPFIISGLVWLKDKSTGFVLLLRVDVGVCVFVHGIARTISGLTGELATQYKRYKYQAMIIDVLAYPFERKWGHCNRINRIEQRNLKLHGKYVTKLKDNK